MTDIIKDKVIGIDVGIAQTTLAVVDIRGTILARAHFPTDDYPEVGGFVTALAEHIVELSEQCGGYEVIRSVGMSAPSGNYLTGCIENASNLRWKGNIPMAAMLRDQIGMSVALGNDAHLSALGEQAFGAAHGMRDFIVISLGHGGVGSCIFSNGKPHLGTTGSAGEIGHVCVSENGRQCNCGKRGCLEEYASDRGLAKTAQKLMAASDEPSLLRSLDQLTPQTIGECCDKGDAMALEVYCRAGEALGIVMAGYATTINPEAIIFTGELVEAGQWLFDPMEKAFNEHIFRNIRNKVRLIVSILDNHDRSILGASVAAWEVPEYSLFI